MLVEERTPFAVVDVETTGFSPKHDRVVEIAVVRVSPAGDVEREYCSLVNPGRALGATHVHGISTTEIASAPTFAEILGDVIEHMRGCVVVGHNVGFDLGFLEAEMARAGWSLPAIPRLCTMAISRLLRLDLPRRNLTTCCEHAGITLALHHSAGRDATATARLLVHYLHLAQRAGLTSVLHLGAEHARVEVEWPAFAACVKAVRRGDAPLGDADESAFLRRVLERLETPPDTARGIEAYHDVLDRALEDRHVTADEAERLYEVARIWALTPADALEAHRRYLRAVIDAALVDGCFTAADEQDALRVATMLGLSRPTLDDLRTEAQAACATAAQLVASTSGKKAHDFVGKSICFTGALRGTVHGERITRAMAESMVSAAGMVVRNSVTKGLDLLVVSDPTAQSTKARKARDCGTRITVEAELWRMLGVEVVLQ